MGRPRTIDDTAILNAARDIFLERGFAGTTAEIARRAGVSEGSLFNRFGNKQRLLQQALEPRIEDVTWVANLRSRVNQGVLKEHLVEIGLAGIAFFQQQLPMIMKVWSHSVELGYASESTSCGRVPIEIMQRLARYFEAEIKCGRMRRVDAEIVARTFLAAMHNYAFFEILLNDHEALPLPTGMYVRGMVDTLWSGIEPLVTDI